MIFFLFLIFFIFGMIATICGIIKSYGNSWAKVRPGDIVILRNPLGKHISLIAIRDSFFGIRYMPLYKDKNGKIDLSFLHPRSESIGVFFLIIQNFDILRIDKTYRELYERTYAHKFTKS